MTVDQAIIMAIIACTMALFISDRWRFDLIAIGSLMAGVLTGVVPQDRAFSGFSDPAVITVIAVLMISRALATSGVVDLLATRITALAHGRLGQLLTLMVTGAGLSAFMNNIGALALVMPVALANARRFKYSPASVLMPLSFATLLGGLITLIGTPPNLLIAAFRDRAVGERFGMFDFTPVGLAVGAAGIAYMALLGWRLILDEKLLMLGRMAQTLSQGGTPAKAIFGSAKNLIAGVLLILPGIISDAIAVLLLLVPAPKPVFVSRETPGNKSTDGRAANDDVIEGEFRRED